MSLLPIIKLKIHSFSHSYYFQRWIKLTPSLIAFKKKKIYITVTFSVKLIYNYVN